MRRINVLNMTALFSREMLLYSFFDVQLARPMRVKVLGYFLGVFAIFSIPLFIVFGISNIYIVSAMLVVPGFASYFLSKPIWGGKSFFAWVKCQFKYILSPKIYFDGHYGKPLKRYSTSQIIQVSRRDDYERLKERLENAQSS